LAIVARASAVWNTVWFASSLTVTRSRRGAARRARGDRDGATWFRRAWEALNATRRATLELTDDARGWLAVADPDQLDQVLWALLDNAVKYGGREGRVEVAVPRRTTRSIRIHVTNHRPWPELPRRIAGASSPAFTRARASPRRGHRTRPLTCRRQLLQAMGGELWLEPAKTSGGAAFTLALPGEPPADEG